MKQLQTDFSDILRLLFFKYSPEICEQLDLQDEEIFSNPLFFAFFNNFKGLSNSEALFRELIQGFLPDFQIRNIKVGNSLNRDGVAYIPRVGYFNKNKEKIDSITRIMDFEILKEIHPLLDTYFVEFYRGQIVTNNPDYSPAWRSGYNDLESALCLIKNHLPGFYKILKLHNRKIYLHNNSSIINFTSIETLGLLNFYVRNSENTVYFIEELIHQGSHNHLYYLIQNREDYFKIDVENVMMNSLTNEDWDTYRSIYGAFHGLFTVTTRLVYFDKLMEANVLQGRKKHELYGRFADMYTRFNSGFENIDHDLIFTKDGLKFYNDLNEKGKRILNKRKEVVNFFDLSNRDLDFRYSDFISLNPIDKFQKIFE